jgi:hypothetical protein
MGGASYISGVQTSPGVHQLLVASGNNVLARSWSNYTDNGSTYSAYATFGSIVLTEPGQMADVQSVTTEFKAVGSQPSIYFLPNEVSGDFIPLQNPENDPPQLPPSKSIYSNRYYLSQTDTPYTMRHLLLKVQFASENAANEMWGYSLYGAISAD